MYIKPLNYRFSSFLKVIVAVVLAYFAAMKIIYDKTTLGFIFFVVFMTLIYIKKPAWALAVLIILAINIFGAVPLTDFPSISMGGLGSLLVHDILLLTFLGIMFLKTIGIKNILTRSSISNAILAFILLTVLVAVLSFLREADLHFIMQHMRPFAYYLFYFLILSAFKSEDELIKFMKMIVIIAIISAGVTYYQAITGELILSIDKRYHGEFGLYQTLNLGGAAMVCVFLSLFSLLIGKKRNIKYLLPSGLILCWIGGAILIMLIRGVWLSTLVAIVIIIVFHSTKRMKSIVILLLLFAVFGVGFSVIERLSGSKRLSYIITERVRKIPSSFRDRTEIMMQSRLNYLIDNPSLFGHGFKGKIGYESDRYDPMVVTGHNLFGDLAARFGFSGFLIFGWLLFAVFRQTIRLLRILPVTWQKSVVCGLLAFNIQTVIYAYSANTYFGIWGIIIIASSWAMLELIERFHKQEQRRSLTTAE